MDAGAKHERANELVTELWEQQTGIVSTQVLQEFYVTVTTKLPKPVKPNRARGIVRAYSRWRLETNGIDAILLASELQEKHRISFWDGLIIAAAARSGAERLLTEDLHDGQLIEGVLISEPFAR